VSYYTTMRNVHLSLSTRMKVTLQITYMVCYINLQHFKYVLN